MKRKDPKYKHTYAMLLDDSELDNFINQKVIEANHFANKVYINTGSKSALEFLNNLSISSTEVANIFPEIVFVDINMPMMDGFQFLENLKSKLPEKFDSLKLVILTSSVNPDDRIKASEISKSIVFLNKPLTKEMLDQL
ncbi:MAG: response regulator [Bacteroidota bacterium]|nr:response regulator [Bacteroidota bacterium]MDP3144324.1 response regulator [Bacteroidota bacterium]